MRIGLDAELDYNHIPANSFGEFVSRPRKDLLPSWAESSDSVSN